MVSEQAGTVGPGVWKVGACQAVVAVVTVLGSKLVVVYVCRRVVRATYYA
jgi:hypothetical protein